ncbi:hypothetical protein ACHMW5_13890 [Azospirillum melinis]|uniref:hypothetical protein n=1 Tax=Azospirillum melinis TaxID=328839 RepID=UPI0037584BDF
MTKPITGLPKGHVPRFSPPADRSHLFGSHTQEARKLRSAADAADWTGDHDTAKRLYARADWHRNEAATHGDLAPLF